jgi:hypothetical protein
VRPAGRRAVTLAGLGVAVAVVAIAGLVVVARRDATPTTALGPPRFVDEAAASGIAHTYAGEYVYAVGGGVAVFDCDADERPDLYFAGGVNEAALYRNGSATGGPLAFTRLRDPATDLAGVNGAYPFDLEGDGDVDLAVLRVGENVLLRGLGGCRFERANEALGFPGGNGWTTAFSATWEGDSGLPTLAVGDYLALDPAGEPGDDCAPNQLLRPRADGSGYGPGIPLTPGYCALSMLFSDWDRSGRRDLRVSNDRHYYDPNDGEEQLWRMASGEPPRAYTAADGWVQMQIWGMGIASHDLTGDGLPEVYLTNQGPNKLQTLTAGPAQPTYRDIGLRLGADAAKPFTGGDDQPSTAWHAEFGDVNDDGFADLFVAKGNVDEQPGFATRDPSNLMLGQPDGTFREVAEAAGVLSYARGRGASLADLNLDGLPDLVEVNYGQPVGVWRNVGAGDASRPAPMGRWIAVRVTQDGPNRDAIGAWVEVRVGGVLLRREHSVGGGHAGGTLGWLHVGLGGADEVDVRVQWPDGQVGPWQRVAANQFVELDRGAAGPRTWRPGDV